MRKILALLISLLLLAATAITAFAAGSVNVSIRSQSGDVKPGDTVSFQVSMDAVEDCRSGGIVLSYDSNVFEFVSGTCLLANTFMSDFSGGTGVFAFAEGQSISGNVFSFTLKVKDTAPYGTHVVSGTATIRTGDGALQTVVSGANISLNCSHVYGSWTDSGNDVHQRICAGCGGTENAGHNWDGGKVVKAPTCKEPGETVYTCTDCGGEKTEYPAKTETHSYGSWEKADEASHKSLCGVCGAEQTAVHSWDGGKVVKAPTCKEPGETVYTCTDCGGEKMETAEKTTLHTYRNDCDTTCDVCDAVREITHQYQTKWTSSKEGHWYACAVCGEKKDFSEHTPGKEPTQTQPQRCVHCGYVLKGALGHKHSYQSELSSDESGHWYACSGCDLRDVKAHEYDNACDGSCDACGYTRKTDHVVGDAWSFDEKEHWHICAECGEMLDAASHVPGAEATEPAGQVCAACGYEIAPKLEPTNAATEPAVQMPADTVPFAGKPEQETANAEGSAWWIMLLGLAAAGLAGAALMIRRKTRSGR